MKYIKYGYKVDMPDITSSVEEIYVDIIQGPSQIICPDTAKHQSNHTVIQI